MGHRYRDIGRTLLDAGFEPIPLHGKRPMVDDWTNVAIDADQVEKWGSNGVGSCNVGVRCGSLQAIDVDVYDHAAAAEVATWLEQELNGGAPLVRRYGQRPKFLIPCIISGLSAKARSDIYFDGSGAKHCIEVLATGQQFAAYGEHPDTGTEYEWEKGTLEDLGLIGLPEFDEMDITGLLFDFFDEMAARRGWTKKAPKTAGSRPGTGDPFADLKTPGATFDELRDQVRRLPMWVCDNRDEWVKVGMIIHFETGGSEQGFQLFDWWSRLSGKYQGEKDTRTRWESFRHAKNGDQIATFGSLTTYEEELCLNDCNSDSVTNVTNVTSVTPVTACHSDVTSKSQVVTREVVRPDGLISGTLWQYITESDGELSTFQIYQEFNLKTRAEKDAARKALQRFCEQGKLEKVPMKRGFYSIVETELERMELVEDEDPVFPLVLPLGLHHKLKVLHGSVAIVGGTTNSGKTAFFLETIAHLLTTGMTKNGTPLYRDKDQDSLREFSVSLAGQIWTPPPGFSIRYLNSEMSAAEIVARVRPFGEEMAEAMRTKVEWIRRPHDWSRAINPNGLNIIDYLQIYDDFYRIGQLISDIHAKLDKGIALIAIQKKTGEVNPRGGEFALERSRLAINLDANVPYGGICSLRKVKTPTDYLRNPQGMEIDYQIGEDGRLHPRSDLRFVSKKERQAVNAKYERFDRGAEIHQDFFGEGTE